MNAYFIAEVADERMTERARSAELARRASGSRRRTGTSRAWPAAGVRWRRRAAAPSPLRTPAPISD